jgi:hypothetical protein
MASCPTSFQPHPVLTNTCVAQCKPEFEVRIVQGVPRCVYKTNADVSYQLNPLTAPVSASAAASELVRTDGQAAIQLERVGSEARIRDAFIQLQAAENARNEAPEAYQLARTRYYTLTNGDSWLAEERTRVSNAEVLPTVQQYMSQYTDLSARVAQHQQTYDVVQSVKDNVLSLKDEVEYSVGTLGKQITDLKDQINVKRRERKEAPPDILSWIDILLNGLLIIVLVLAVFLVYRKVSSAYTLGRTTYGG